MTKIRRSTTFAAMTALAVGLGLTTVGVYAPASNAAGHQASKAKTTPTEFALRTSGFGTRVTGGQVPAESGTTAYQVIGCTNDAGVARDNNAASVELPGLGTVSGVKTRVWTTTTKNVTSSWSRHSLASVVLSDSPLGTLLIDAVSTTARAYHDAKGFHTDTDSKIGGLKFKPTAGPEMTLPIPTPGQPVEIPGFGTVTIGHSNVHKNATSARAFANGLKVDLTASGSMVQIAHAQAEIFKGVRSGIFHGSATGITGELAGGAVNLGKNPLSLMPCQGTGGKLMTKKLAGAFAQDQLRASGVHNEQKAQANDKKAWGFERSTVASINLGGGQLEVDGIVAQANVTRQGNKVISDIKGTRVGTITANGEAQSLPDTGVLEIPGVAKLETGIVKKTKKGISVVGLRITLLGGSGGVIDLATATMRIDKSGV